MSDLVKYKTVDGDYLYYIDDKSTVEYVEGFYKTRTDNTTIINSNLHGIINVRVAQEFVNTDINVQNNLKLDQYNNFNNTTIDAEEGLILLSKLDGAKIKGRNVCLNRTRLLDTVNIDVDCNIYIMESTWV